MSHFESDEEESCSSSSSSSTACRKRSHGDAAALATKKRAVDDETSTTSEQSGEAEAPPAPRAACVPWVTHDATVAQHFVLLTQLSHTLRADFGAAQRNMAKNRYANVLANDETRVRLSAAAECGAEGDYVNANLCASGRFIATQAPLEHTVADFWTMLLEQRTRVVVCLTKFEANRAFDYLPARGRSTRHGAISVHTRGAVQYGDDLLVRYLLVQRDGDGVDGQAPPPRGIVHLQFVGWPDFGVPDSHEPVLRLHALMHAFRTKLATCDADLAAPYAVAHCSAGIGRAGTFIAASALIEQLVDGAAVSAPAPPAPLSPAHRAFVENIISAIEVSPAAVFDDAAAAAATAVPVPPAPPVLVDDGCCAPSPASSSPSSPNASTTSNASNATASPADASESAGIFATWALAQSPTPSSSSDADSDSAAVSVVPALEAPTANAASPSSAAAAAIAAKRPIAPELVVVGPPSPQLLSAVFQTVLNLRKARRGCVQTVVQYQFIVGIVTALSQHLAAQARVAASATPSLLCH